MKKVFSLVIVLALVLGLTSSAMAAAPAPGGPFNTEFIVQNLEGTEATCSFILYNSAGASAFTSSTFSLAANDKMSFYTGGSAFSTLPDGEYSSVVSCNKKVAAVVNFSDPNSGAAHSGIDTPGTSFYAPVIYNNFYGYFTNVYVQNASATPVDVTVDIYAAGGTSPVKTQTATGVAAYASVHFEQEGLAELLTNTAYSAKITATGNIAVIANIYGGPNNDQLYSYNGFPGGSLTASTPAIYKNYYGYNTNLAIQNIGAGDTGITVEYFDNAGVVVRTDTYTVTANSVQSIYTPNLTGFNPNTLYSAKVTSSTEPVIAIVNESNAGLQAASYNGFVEGATEMRSPVVMKNYYTYNTSVTCLNIGTAPADITITYAGIGTPTVATGVPVNGLKEFYQPTDPNLAGVPVNWSSSATVTATQNIVCVINESSGSLPGDQLYSFNGVKP